MKEMITTKPLKQGKLSKALEKEVKIIPDLNIVNQEMFDKIREQLAKEEGNEELLQYDPLVEIAKIGINPLVTDELKLRCHDTIAGYIYPKVKSLEVSSKQDNSINININVKSYSKEKKGEISPDNIDIVDAEIEEMTEETLQ